MISWWEWVAKVESIAKGRGISLTRFDQPGGVLRCLFVGTDPRNPGTTWTVYAQAGVELLQLTTPEQFTNLWHLPPLAALSSDASYEKSARYVPRIPARAVSMALEVLFS